MMMGGVAVVVAVIGLVLYLGVSKSPKHEDVAGTVGAAQRYRAGQLTAADVQLENMDLQRFMQTDVFHRLVTDPAARKALSSPDFGKIAADPQIARALASLSADLARSAAKDMDQGKVAVRGGVPTRDADLGRAAARDVATRDADLGRAAARDVAT